MAVRIEIDPSAGVCFGVKKAIQTAEDLLDKGEQVFGLGNMLHNPAEIRRLSEKGLKTVSVGDFPGIRKGKVLLRAHGEPPDTYRKAAKAGIDLIDATCPIVQKLQKKILKKYHELNPATEQIVLFGKKDHPETIGLLGQTNNEAILVTDPDDIGHIPGNKKSFLYSQTTMDPEAYDRLVIALKDKISIENKSELKAECSICNQMKHRKPDLAEFARKCEVLIFASGKDSSNGRMLFEYARNINEQTYWIERPEEVDPQWVNNAGFVGISGATSTPAWQLELIKKQIESLTAG